MCSSSFSLKIKALLILLAQIVSPLSAYGKQASKTSRADRSYSKIIKKEKKKYSDHEIYERIFSGAAALTIGLYGYYNDNRGVLTSLAYNATQTAGVVMISEALYDHQRPSLLLTIDKHLSRRDTIDYERFRLEIAKAEFERRRGEMRQTSLTAGILAVMYAYNAYRDTSNISGLQNTLYFISFNLTLASIGSYVKLRNMKISDRKRPGGFSLILGLQNGIAYEW